MKAIERIIAALPNNQEHRLNALDNLLELVSGNVVHIYYGWNSGFTRLSYATGVSQTLNILSAAKVSITRGNDAPRGGALGDYIKLKRRIPSAIPVIEAEIAAIRARRGY